eukprot:7291327-Prymnesium_polylepis.1
MSMRDVCVWGLCAQASARRLARGARVPASALRAHHVDVRHLHLAVDPPRGVAHAAPAAGSPAGHGKLALPPPLPSSGSGQCSDTHVTLYHVQSAAAGAHTRGKAPGAAVCVARRTGGCAEKVPDTREQVRREEPGEEDEDDAEGGATVVGAEEGARVEEDARQAEQPQQREQVNLLAPARAASKARVRQARDEIDRKPRAQVAQCAAAEAAHGEATVHVPPEEGQGHVRCEEQVDRDLDSVGCRDAKAERDRAARCMRTRVDDEPVEALELILAPLLQRDRIEDRIGAEESPALWVDSPHHLPDPHGSALLAEDGCIAATASIMDQ